MVIVLGVLIAKTGNVCGGDAISGNGHGGWYRSKQ